MTRTRAPLLFASDIDRHDNFFDVGGDSLLLVQLHRLMNFSFERDDPIVELLRHPTVAAYAAFLDGDTSSAPLMTDRAADRIANRRRHVLGVARGRESG